MATRPDEPPESIILGDFKGVRNTIAPERMSPGELEAAVNIDLDDSGQARRRRGYTRVSTGDFHSLYNSGQRLFGVKDGYLGWISNDYTFTSIVSVGPERVSYTTVGDVTYFTARNMSGKIDASDVASPWGVVGGDDTWVSPVLTPTDTLGAIGGKLLHAPPMATEIEHYNGRIYLAAERLLWVTELYQYDYVDKTRGFYQFEYDITMLACADNGIYVGTKGSLHFLSGTHAEGLKRQDVCDFGVIVGSRAMAPAAAVHPAARQGLVPEGDASVFMTTQGICAAFNGGEVHNLTRGRVVFPGMESAAALYREQDGVSSYVAVADSRGAPTSSTRIGDYVDAEIRRFQGG